MTKALTHCKQAAGNGCMSACLAMLTEIPVEQIMADFHDSYRSKLITPQMFLANKGIKWKYEERADDRLVGYLDQGFIYLMSVPSLSRKNETHSILVDYRGEEPIVLDPANKNRIMGSGPLDVRCWSIELIITERINDSIM